MKLRVALVLGALVLVAAAWAFLGVRGGTREPGSPGAPSAPETLELDAERSPTLVDAGRAASTEGVEDAPSARIAVPIAADGKAGENDAAPGSDEPATCVVRLVDGLARPLPELAVEIVHRFPNSSTTEEATTDSEGRLRFPLYSFASLSPPDRVELAAGEGRERRGAALALPADLPPGETDLGDVEMVVVPLLVAGIVQNPAGIPVPNATVWAHRFEVGADGTRTWGEAASMQTQRDGRFELRSWGTKPPDVAVWASHEAAAQAAPIDVRAGADDVVITLQGGGTIVGRVLVDPGVPLASVWVTAIAEDGRSTMIAVDLATGALIARHVPPGRHTVEVRVDGRSELLRTIPDVEVTNLRTTEPPELNPLDLRGAFHPVTVHVVDARGAPVAAQVYFRAAGDRDSAWARQVHTPNAPAVCTVAAPSADVCAGIAGVGSAERFDVAGEIVLTLGGAWEVDVRLAAPIELGERGNGVSLHARLVPFGRPGMGGADAAFAADGTCRMSVTHVGPHEAAFFLNIEGQAFPVVPLSSPTGPPAVVEIVAPRAGGRQLVELEAPASLAEWAGALGGF